MDSSKYDWTRPRDPINDNIYDTPVDPATDHLGVSIPDKNEEDYATALAACREDFGKLKRHGPQIVDDNILAHPSALGTKKQTQQRQQAQGISIVLALSNEFAPLNDLDGDTLIYVGPPPGAPDQSRIDYEYIQQRFRSLHRVKSKVLKDLSSSVLDKLLGPKSERTRRRLGKEGLLTGTNIDGIKFYIDLRPAEEGDEAVELISDLTCTQGVLNWHKAQKKYEIPEILICGRDDFVTIQDQMRDAEAMSQFDPEVEPEAEYSALRHRSAIVRVLQAIFHNDPKLDSAPKLWTYFQVAKHLDVAKHERVNGWISKWLYTHPNSNFIQSNPEVVYRIGMGIMSPTLVCDSYSMLAGEKALLDTTDPSLRLHLKTSVHGRTLELLDDDEKNRIDHAATSLHARIKSKFEALVDENMEWLKGSKEYQKIVHLVTRDETEGETIKTAHALIRTYVRGRIYWVVARNYLSDHAVFDQAMRAARDFRPGLPDAFNETYRTLREDQRLLTRTTWISLHTEKIEDGFVNAWTPTKGRTGVLYLHSSFTSHGPVAVGMLNRELRSEGSGLKEIRLEELIKTVTDINKINARHFADDQLVQQGNTEALNHITGKQGLVPDGGRVNVVESLAESSAVQGKHNLVELDSGDDRDWEMGPISRNRSGSDKIQRLSDQFAEPSSPEISPLGSSLPLRVRNSDLANEDIAAIRVEPDDHAVEKRDGPSNLATAISGIKKQVSPQKAAAPAPKKPSGIQGLDSDSKTFDFNTHARSVAQANKFEEWQSCDGDRYIRALPSYTVDVDIEVFEPETVWFAQPEPFRSSETKWNLASSGIEYWRATTCQLFCRLAGNRFGLVREDRTATPTLSEASSRISDENLLNKYVLAYDAYARNLAEQIQLPYWIALNGDMYLRNPPETMDPEDNIWTYAPFVFDSSRLDKGWENGSNVEYWRAPAGHLFRRRSGRIELFTSGKGEPAPPNAAAVLAAPLKICTDSGEHFSFPPPARYVDSPSSASPLSEKTNARSCKPTKRSVLSSPPTQFPVTYNYDYINTSTMLMQFSDILSRACEDILFPPHLYHGSDPISRDLMDTLMCLTDDEWKYLPLWAGGCDDGTGGVFDEADVPNLEAGGFAGGKRGLGSSVEGSSESDGFTDVGSEAISTVGRASKVATDGTAETSSVLSFDSASGFIEMDGVWEQVNKMKEGDVDEFPRAEGDEVTVMGAASDVQGQFFGDSDDEDGLDAVEDDEFDMVDDSDDAFEPITKD